MDSEFTVGWTLSNSEHATTAALTDIARTAAIDTAGDRREGAVVAELTGTLRSAAFGDYPAEVRTTARREYAHIGE